MSYSYSGNPSDVILEALRIEERETAKDKMKINASKCNLISFNFSKNNSPPQNLEFNGNLIQACNKIKLLGVFITDDLKWHENTKHICSKVNKKMFILCKLKQFGFNRDELIIAWNTIIRPTTEYAVPLWHSGLTKSDENELEKLQKKALGIILGVTYLDYRRYYKLKNEIATYEVALEKLGLIPLSKRREILTSNFALQTFNKGLHKDMFTKKDVLIPTRNPNIVEERLCNSDRHYKSALPNMLRILNTNPLNHEINL